MLFAVTWYTNAICASPIEPAFNLDFKILAVKPHINDSFTQGFELKENIFYESSGLYGQSYLMSYTNQNAILNKKRLPSTIFAEGITVFNDYLYILSWKSNICFRLNKADFSLKKQFTYQGEGWGLTHNDNHLIMSDGTNIIRFIDPNDFTTIRTITITDGTSKRWSNINELEFARGLIWANVWQSPFIIAINPKDGHIVGKIQLGELVKKNTNFPQHEALNGIAYDTSLDAFWVTGKYWPYRYLIDIEQISSDIKSNNSGSESLQ